MKNATKHHRFTARPLAIEISRMFRPGVAAATLLAVPFAFAAPQGGAVTAGQAAIAQNGNTTTITQASQRAAIDWRSFNVGSNETVNFVQPNSSSAVLNRVVGNDASAIFGRISANGQVYLINPNGILFGRSAQVDVGALTATTANISNADFMAGRLSFSQPGKPGAQVENQGSITVGEGGFAALVGRGVVNRGVINARLGKVALAGGDAFVLDLYGDKLVNLIVDPAAMNYLADAHGNPLAASVDHSGQIVADGGRVQLSVATVKQLVDNLINVSGVIRATSFIQSPGQISLLGDANTRVAVSGTLETSGQVGGRIEVTGRDVALQWGAVLAATGGAGSIAVGGDWQGQGALAHAQQVNVASGASIDASAGAQGKGGTVALWSTDSTQFTGRIEARGGSVGGDGGQVEVSSKGRLGFMGDVNVFATHGQQGSLLLDPLNLRIGTVTSGDSEISAEQIRFFLTRGASVSLSADQNVVVDAEVNGLVAGGTGVSGGGLSLTAGNNLTVNESIVLNNGALNLTATNGTLSQADGTVLYTGSGAATLTGGAGVNLGQVLSGGAVDIRSANGAVNVRNALVSASANGSAAPLASLNVDGAGAVSLNGALVQGNATVRSRNAGVSLSTAVIQSNAGNVQVNAGTTLTTGASNVGLVSGGNVSATAAQGIDLGTVISTGTSTLTSTNAGVTVRQAITGGGTAATGGLTVNAAGSVGLAGVNAGAGGININTSSGNITSQSATASEGGLLSSGSVRLQATAGQIGTTGAPIRVQAGGDVDIDGETGVTAATVLSGGSVVLWSESGGITVTQAIAAQPGTISESTVAKPLSVAVVARDGIDMAGAVAGGNGVSLESRAGDITVRNSIFGEGGVDIVAAGAITLLDGAGIVTTREEGLGSVLVQSLNGTVTIGNAGIRAEGPGANVAVFGHGGVAVNGDIQARGASIAVGSTMGSVRVLASNTSNDAALNATLDAGNDALRSSIDVWALGDVEVGELIAHNQVLLSSNMGNVTLHRGLGGNASGTFGGNPVLLNTGYVDYARGYLPQYRPNVGRLVITATNGSVELNGLNLDGNALATDTTAGLSVTAGRRIISNNEIAVNKGDIELTGGNTQATDGVYLGNSVYSRGFDSVGADGVRGGGDDQKTGYAIRISGRVLGLFDNTLEMAQLPVNTFVTSWYEAGPGSPPPLHQVRTDAEGFVVDSAGLRVRNPDGSYQLVGILSGGGFDPSNLAVYNVNAAGTIVSGPNAGVTPGKVRGVPSVEDADGRAVVVTQEIAKIEIANNVANYQDPANAGTLVAATTGSAASRQIEIDTTTIAGVANHTPQTPMRLTDAAPVLTAPSQAPIVSVPTQAGVVAATRGIGLKLLSFREAGDASSQIWSNNVRMINAGDSNFFFFRLTGTGGALTLNSLVASVPVEGVFTVTTPALAVRTYRDSGGDLITEVAQLPTGAGTAVHTFRIEDGANGSEVARLVGPAVLSGIDLSSLSATAPAGSTQVTAWVASGWREPDTVARFRLEPPQLSVAGAANGVQVSGALLTTTGALGTALQTGANIAPAYRVMVPNLLQPEPFQALQALNPLSEPRTFQVNDVLSDSVSGTAGRIGTRVFVYDGVIDTSNGTRTFDSNTGVAIPGLGGIPGFNNSTVGFAGVGAGFGALVGGTTTATGSGGASGQGVSGVTIPGGQSGVGAAPSFDDRSAQDAAGSGLVNSAASGQPGGAEVIFSSRAAAQADLGRGGAVPGSAVNVFKRSYKVATSTSGTVCAADAVQQTPAEGTATRDCPAAK